MNVDLIDHLVCPRCGPPNGLLLLAHDVQDRRVREGEFGCPNCRDRFPVSGGVGDLRPPPRGEGPEGAGGGEDADVGAAERALRIAAALGVTRGPGLMVVTDAHRAEAPHLARLVDGIEVLVVGRGGREMVAEGTAAEGVSAFVAGPAAAAAGWRRAWGGGRWAGGRGVVGGGSPRPDGGRQARDHGGHARGAGLGGGGGAGGGARRGRDGGRRGPRPGRGAAIGAVGGEGGRAGP